MSKMKAFLKCYTVLNVGEARVKFVLSTSCDARKLINKEEEKNCIKKKWLRDVSKFGLSIFE